MKLGKKRLTLFNKKDLKVDPGKCKSVNLTSAIGKMAESTVRDHLVENRMLHNLFCDTQHRFLLGHLCNTRLIVTPEPWSEILDSRAAINAVYLDFRKVLDTIPYQR